MEQLKTKYLNGQPYIFDPFRKKYISLTPEEWVRQQFLHFLTHVKSYPASVISVEKMINIQNLQKRYDAVVYKNAVPWMLIECKAENVTISENTLQQILAYNTVLKVNYLVITNGHEIHVYDVNHQQWGQEIPIYDE
jgi:Type I restriction enzyme R protein N terminus (HSDR_N).